MTYDAIIVGSGMSGGALAYRLTQQGYRVLLLERGKAKKDWSPEFAKDYSEKFCDGEWSREDVYSRSGRGVYKVNEWTPVIGGGEGGGTSVYGSVLLRFYPHDFIHWPLTYRELAPYYQESERLLQPRGGKDPLFEEHRNLQAPRPLSKTGEEIFAFFKSQNLHPFQTTVGYKASPDCQSCFGHFCPRDCKATSSNVFIEPALKTGLLQVEYETCVESLIHSKDTIQAVLCRGPNGTKEFRASCFFLAAGALATPAILLNSKSEFFPSGLGNQFDLIGRFLMRHLIDFYFVKTPSSAMASGHLNEISVSDYQQPQWGRLGLLSFVPGLMPVPIMAREVVARLQAQSHWPLVKPILAFVLEAYLKRATLNKTLITSILEDSPQFGNRVSLGRSVDDLRVSYRIGPGDRLRLKSSRQHFQKLLAPLNVSLVKVAEDHSFLAHSCGTCRMSSDPTKGVVDTNGKVHGLQNLYIADASIFPSSGGVNPALTVAALALKIAHEFLEERNAR